MFSNVNKTKLGYNDGGDIQVQVQVTLQLTVRQPVGLGVEPLSETYYFECLKLGICDEILRTKQSRKYIGRDSERFLNPSGEHFITH
jgi:hypothetical protein